MALATSLIIAAVVLVLGLLLLRFVLKTAFTVLKIALLVGIAVAVFFGVDALVG